MALFRHGWNFIAGAKDVHVHSHKIIVNPPAIKGKESHHQNDMSEFAKHFEGGSLDGVVPEDQENTEGQEGSAVSDIAEHDAEEEGESDGGEDGGVELLVAGDSVSVGDFLGDESVAVGVEGGGRFAEFDLMQCG